MKLLLNVDYRDDTGKFWQDSYIKNTVVDFNGNVHDTIAKALEDIDHMHVSYKRKPRGNVYRDRKDGTSERIGYIYRVQSDIYEGNKTYKALFDAWVTVLGVESVTIDDIDGL